MNLKENVTSFQFEKGDYLALDEFYANADWSFISESNDLDKIILKFYDVLHKGIKRFVPSKSVSSQKFPSWYSFECRKLINYRNKLYRVFKKSGSENDYARYSSVRREVKFHLELSYLSYVSNTEHMMTRNVKYFWSFINNLNKGNALPKAMKLNGKNLSLSEIPNAFADHFQSCFCDHFNVSLNNTVVIEDKDTTLSSHTFTTEEIIQKINLLDTHKKAGPDGIPPLLLKKCSFSLVVPLKQIFQLSFNLGVFPTY